MDPYRPNTAVKIRGEYRLYTVSFRGTNKIIQVGAAASLDGPWRIQPEPVVDLGASGSFDAHHVNVVTVYYFEERDEILLYYMGYPESPQADQLFSPYGSSAAAAVMRPEDKAAKKLGKAIGPADDPGHWIAGWVSTLQIFPAHQGGWYSLLSASPNPPAPVQDEPSMREPAPSLGGWAYTASDWPVGGWRVEEEPIIRIGEIPPEARRAGEDVNLWRHHLLMHPDGRAYLFYNSGAYGQERLFARRAWE